MSSKLSPFLAGCIDHTSFSNPIHSSKWGAGAPLSNAMLISILSGTFLAVVARAVSAPKASKALRALSQTNTLRVPRRLRWRSPSPLTSPLPPLRRDPHKRGAREFAVHTRRTGSTRRCSTNTTGTWSGNQTLRGWSGLRRGTTRRTPARRSAPTSWKSCGC